MSLLGVLRQYKTDAVTDDRLYHVTITHLLRHTAGWDHSVISDPLVRRDIGLLLNQSGPIDKDDIIRYMMTQPIEFDPGQLGPRGHRGHSVRHSNVLI